MLSLDTNVVIAFLRGRPAGVSIRLGAAIERGDDLAISSLVLFELYYGAARSARPAENVERILTFLSGPIAVWPFEGEDADEAGRLRATLESTGRQIGPYDLLIAAQTRRRGGTIVTANTREFARIAGLKRLDWTARLPTV